MTPLPTHGSMFTAEQLVFLQCALGPPPPPLVPPPQMLAAAAQQVESQGPPILHCRRPRAPCDIPLVLAVVLLVGTAVQLAICHLLDSDNLWLDAMVWAPCFSTGMTMLVMTLDSPACKVLGMALATGYPGVCLVANEWFSWVFCLGMSVFMAALAGFGLFGRFALAGVVGVWSIPALFYLRAPFHITWGFALAVLCLQSIVGLNRLYRASLVVTMRDYGI